MNYKSPEQAGISSRAIGAYIAHLERAGLSTHAMIIAHGDDILFEHYWPPFDECFLHRQYSVSKSIVAIAIGFAVQDGLISLDDGIADYFKEYLIDDNYRRQTVRDMLMMANEKVDRNWFAAKPDDRVRYYFANDYASTKGTGMLFDYDSSGSFVLGALVERVSGKSLVDYLRLKLFDEIGVSKEAYCLSCPGGYSWGDSGMMLTARDMLKIARFVMNLGEWKGRQLLDAKYLIDATSPLISTDDHGVDDYNTQGYGYLIWRTYDNSFAFLGMGCQYVICIPDRDLVLVTNGDNQGISSAAKTIFDGFFSYIARPQAPVPLEEDPLAQAELEVYRKTLRLAVARGETISPMADMINERTYILGQNSMGISWLRLELDSKYGKLHYENASGEKCIEFGIGENAFADFPEEGMADLVGTVSVPGHRYACAASGAWIEPHKLRIKVQIIDKYFGRLDILLAFREDTCAIRMIKSAEAFLGNYVGWAEGKLTDERIRS